MKGTVKNLTLVATMAIMMSACSTMTTVVEKQQDVVPNLQTVAWLDTGTVNPGEYNIYCAEMCGKSHSQMLAKIYIT